MLDVKMRDERLEVEVRLAIIIKLRFVFIVK